MLKTKLLVAFATASLSLATAGTLVIDDFSVNQGPGALTTSGSDGPLNIGGSITRTLALNSLGGLVPVQHTLQATGGILDVTNGVGDDASVVITYSLPALAVPSGATNVRLTLRVIQSDGNATSLNLGGLFSGSFNIPGNTINQDVSFAIAGPPVGPGSATITLQGDPGWDLGIDAIGLSWDDPTTTPVPEPSTYALIGLGLTGMALLRRK